MSLSHFSLAASSHRLCQLAMSLSRRGGRSLARACSSRRLHVSDCAMTFLDQILSNICNSCSYSTLSGLLLDTISDKRKAIIGRAALLNQVVSPSLGVIPIELFNHPATYVKYKHIHRHPPEIPLNWCEVCCDPGGQLRSIRAEERYPLPKPHIPITNPEISSRCISGSPNQCGAIGYGLRTVDPGIHS